MKNPRAAALAYRIHCVASPRGWDMTLTEIADELNVSTARVRKICIDKGWVSRLRAQRNDQSPFGAYAPTRIGADDARELGV